MLMKKYQLERKSFTNVIWDNFSDTLKSFGAFVACGSLTGISYGFVRSFTLASQQLGRVEDNGALAPIFFFFMSIYYAKQVYNNFKNDKARYKQLAHEIEKERARQLEMKIKAKEKKAQEQAEYDDFVKTYYSPSDNIIELQKYRDALSTSSGVEASKRMSLNNGVFKSNDTY